jgi:hypothetical protein
MNCPLCKTLYGFDVELEELQMDERKIFQCKNKNLKHQFCEHVLAATRKDLANFACQDCSSNIDECDCFDCFVFCGKCNSFLFISCSDVIQMMELRRKADGTVSA